MTAPALTEGVLRTVDINEGPDLPAAVLDGLVAAGHERYGFCDSCWATAGDRATNQQSKTQAQHYVDVLDELRTKEIP